MYYGSIVERHEWRPLHHCTCHNQAVKVLKRLHCNRLDPSTLLFFRAISEALKKVG